MKPIGLIILSLTLISCAAMRTDTIRQDSIHRQVRDYVYNKPIDQVWPYVRQMLFHRGYQVRHADRHQPDDGYTIETEWLETGADPNRWRSRYLVQGIDVDATHCKLLISRSTEASVSGQLSGSRDFETEWALIREVEPDRAEQITTTAQKAALDAR